MIFLRFLALLALLPISLSAMGNLSFSGNYFGVYNYTHQSSSLRAQFDFAANIDLEYKLSKNISGIIQLQGGPGNGELGFAGPNLLVTDIAIQYAHNPTQTQFTFGSFDTPFGYFTSELTNNADISRNPLILNSLLYSAWVSSPVGTLNTLGVMAKKTLPFADVTLALSNGTGEDAINEGNSFEVVASIQTQALNPNLISSLSYINSKDLADSANSSSSSFKSNIEGVILDSKYTMFDVLVLGGYFGQLTYNDNDASTQDKVSFWMIETSLKMGSATVAARYSLWEPEDRDGSGSGISAGIPNAGLSVSTGTFTPILDSKISRLQLGVRQPLDGTLGVAVEGFIDDYTHGEDAKGALVAIFGQF